MLLWLSVRVEFVAHLKKSDETAAENWTDEQGDLSSDHYQNDSKHGLFHGNGQSNESECDENGCRVIREIIV
ncbi:hypothetical protein COOONC_02351 [Cooperia oncophora]